MTSCWCCMLFFLGLGALPKDSQGQLLSFSSPVTATASTSYQTPRLQFAPQLAVQADTSNTWGLCFISAKQSNPWFRLEFQSATDIFNIRLVVIIRETGQTDVPSDFDLSGMDNLTVYVTNSSTLVGNTSDRQSCDNPWRYTPTTDIQIKCNRRLRGRFVHVTIPSPSPTYLLICSVVVNRENGPMSPLTLSEERTTLQSSGFNPSRPPTLAIDGLTTANETSCSSLTGMGTTWLRVDIQKARYIKEVRLLFLGNISAAARALIGRSLRRNGAADNTRCGSAFTSVAGFHWQNLTCSLPIFGQYIYIETMTSTMRICEIQVFYDYTLNLYRPLDVTASDQKNPNSAIWKPIDGVLGVQGSSNDNSWIPQYSPRSWWRMELPRRTAISRVEIRTRQLDSTRRARMDGFTVRVGDSTDGNGGSNPLCGAPWVASNTRVIVMSCPQNTFGKYLYVTSADRVEACLYLVEIFLYGCEEPRALIASGVGRQTLHFFESTTLTCQGTTPGCNVTAVEWFGPDGKPINTALNTTLDYRLVSSIFVTGMTGGGQYGCTIRYPGGSDKTNYVITVPPHFTVHPRSQRVDYLSTASLQCAAVGYPSVTAEWNGPNGIVPPTSQSNHRYPQSLASTLNVTIGQEAEGGGEYKCVVKNVEGTRISSVAFLSVSPIIISLPQSITVGAGSTVELRCTAAGYPAVSIGWTAAGGNTLAIKSVLRDGNKVTSIVSITNNEGADGGGIYTCTPSNMEQSGANLSATVTVNPAVTVVPSGLTAKEGQIAGRLQCVANGYPQPTITWYKNDAILSDGITDNTYSVTNRYGKDLDVGLASLSDNGAVYTCEVRQGTYVARASSVLTVKPDVVLKSSPRSVVGSVGDVINLTCEAEGQSLDTIQWTVDNTLVQPRSTHYNISDITVGNVTKSVLTIKRLELFHGAVEYRCTAGTREYPDIQVSDAANVRVLGEITSFRDTAYDIGIHSKEPFSCLFTSNPQADAMLQFDSVAVPGTHVQSEGQYQHNISLPVMDINAQIAGIYRCFVSFSRSSLNVSSTAQLQIFPSVTLTSNVTATISAPSPLRLTCTALGFPLPTVTWFRTHGSDTVNVTSLSTSTLDFSAKRTVSIITYQDAFLDEAGDYTCVASSSLQKNGEPISATSLPTSVQVATKAHSTSSDDTPIIAGAAGAAGGVLVLVLVLLICMRKWCKRRSFRSHDKSSYNFHNPIAMSTTARTSVEQGKGTNDDQDRYTEMTGMTSNSAYNVVAAKQTGYEQKSSSPLYMTVA